MQLDLPVSELFSKYPLSEESDSESELSVEVFSEDIQLEGLKIRMMGLSLPLNTDFTLTASAVELNTLPSLRAYFELVERFSTWKAISQPSDHFEVFDIQRGTVSTVNKSDVFPVSPQVNLWNYSKSNGVAAHLSFEKAAKAAAMELIERDRILRAWYLGSKLIRLDLPKTYLTQMLQTNYQVELFSFSKTPSVVGIFGFPKDKTHPLIFGFGASDDALNAIAHAERELIQRWAFLWGEPLPDMQPISSPTPDFHQEYYLFPDNIPILKKWLLGEFISSNVVESQWNSLYDLQVSDISYIDLTPRHLKSKLSVVKAYSKKAIPLTFGQLHPYFNSVYNVHPIA